MGVNGISGIGVHSGTGVVSHFVGIGVLIGIGADWSAIRAVICSVSIRVHGSGVSSCSMGTLKNLRGLTGLRVF